MIMDFNEHDCLSVNPFEGDFGDPSDRVLKDKIVTTRKDNECFLCNNKILKGERSRVLTCIFDGELESYRWCSECCHAMAVSIEDVGEAWEERCRIGRGEI